MTANIGLRCAGVHRFIDTYLDGEFGERERAEMEAHLADCEGCRAKVKQQASFHLALRAAIPPAAAPAALRNRVQRSLAREVGGPRRWRRFVLTAMPIAAVAGIVGTVALSRLHWSPVAIDVIAKHQRNLPMEVQGDVNNVRRWYNGKLDFAVRPPRLMGASLRGGRLANVGNQSAAYLLYDANGNRVSVFIFDPGGDLRIDASKKRLVGDREVYLDEERGYRVAMFREEGMGYAIASDVDEGQMMRLVSGAVAP